MRRLRNVFAALLALNLVFGTLFSSAFAASATSDEDKHWAADTLKKWTASGLLTGYPDGTYRPNDPVKRSEFVTMLNRALKLSQAAENVSFSDLSDKHWAYRQIAIALKAGYLQGANGKVNPEQFTTRQEAAVMIAKAFKLDTKAGGDVSQFGDADQIAAWGKDAIAALASNQVFKGDQNGNVNPRANITRAEAVVAIDAALGLGLVAAKVYDKAGTYGPANSTETIDGNVIIAADGVTLQNTIINGDLIIAEEVQEGDVTLKKVEVKGTTKVNGGGENSVHIEDSVLLRIIVDKASGKVRIVAIGATSVQDVIVNSSVKIEESNVTDTGFKNIQLSDALPEGASADLIGHFEDVQVMAANIQVNIPSGSIENLHVQEGANDSTINLSKEAKVQQLVLDVVSKLIGEGTIDKATVNDNAKGSSFESKPAEVDGAAKDDIAVTAPTAPTGSTGTGGGSPSGNNNSGNPGNNGDDNGGAPSCNTDECSNAKLIGLSVTKGVYEPLTLIQRDNGRVVIGEGFNPDVFAYTVEIPDNFDGEILLSMTSEANAKMTYYFYNGNTDDSYGERMSGGEQKRSILVRPKQDIRIEIVVTSENERFSKSYDIRFVYTRDIQDAFRLESGKYGYTLVTRALEDGDQIEVTIPANDSKTTLADIVTAEVRSLSAYIYLSNFQPANDTGTLHIKVTRAGNEILNGDYSYDVTPLTALTDVTGFSIQMLTKQELQDIDGRVNLVQRASYGYRVELHPGNVTNPALQGAKYFRVDRSSIIYVSDQPRVPTLEDGKLGYDKWSHTLSAFREGHGYSTAVHGIDQVRHEHILVIFYDHNKSPLGYYVFTAAYDDDHVGVDSTVTPPISN